jgi:hypothetical protein
LLEDYIVPLTNANDKSETISVLKGLMQTFTKTKINLKEQVAKVIAAKPAMLAAIAK